MNEADVGDIQTLTAIFTDSAGVAVDPTTVTCKVKTPDGVTTTYSPTKKATGEYAYNFTVTQPGIHYYRFAGSGAVVAAGENSFAVRIQKVV